MSSSISGTTIGSNKHRCRRSSYVVGAFVAIAVVAILQFRSEAGLNRYTLTNLPISSKSQSLSSDTAAIDDTVPNLIECLDTCLHVGHPTGCYNSSGVPIRGADRRTDEWKQVTDSNSLLSLTFPDEKNYTSNDSYTNVNKTTTIFTGNAVVVFQIRTPLRNINHIFHDDFWPVLSFFSQPSTLQKQSYDNDSKKKNVSTVNVTFLHDYTSSWLTALLDIIVQAYPWWNIIPELPSFQDRWICTSLSQHEQKQKLYVNGYIRDMHYYQLAELSRIRNDLRTVAWGEVTKQAARFKLLENANVTAAEAEALSRKELIVIYKREDMWSRQIHDTDKILDAFDLDRYAVHIQRYMPSSFLEQVALFGMADLLIAPNGGWTPNVLWMKDTACLVEIHLYKTNSWLVKYGLSSLFQPTHHVQIVTGDYHNATLYGPAVIIPNRHGGDDEIQGSMVIADIVRQLQQSPDCQRFLRTTVPTPVT